ncbi:3-deoxy-7-phosphoheptulonate synthase [Nocardia sp. NPDC051570]|uniref:3-deoxy-7-phosphoheptulonate synthase n=1 Tax=Nocardia sp. NPDC051570 TaxID=3364324 RepID=UPI0037A8BA86
MLTEEFADSTVSQFFPGGIGGRHQVGSISSPGQLLGELPLSRAAAHSVYTGRLAVSSVLAGSDDRLLVVVGPCSIHDVSAGLVYAKSLVKLADSLADDLVIVMRAYVEKPRTVAGWTGLLTDPALDGSLDLNRGLRMARTLMLKVAEQGLAVATEWLSPAAPAYLADLISWGAIGARTVESQVHRQIASGLPMPVGMKNNITGSVQVAVDAMRFAANPHTYITHNLDGRSVAFRTTGNPHCHVVLRGASGRPNYDSAGVRNAVHLLTAAGLPTGLVIDASHGNSGKDHERQAVVAREIGAQVADGDRDIRGVMLESFLVAGRQELGNGEPVFGQSVTDACMSWDATVHVLRDLAEAVRRRRSGSRRSQGSSTNDYHDRVGL